MALSTGEAELYGVVKGAGALMGAVSLARDLGLDVRGVLHTDSSAAKGIVSRRGLGKVKHVDVRKLWIQDVVRSGRIGIVKIPGGENAADVLKTYQDGPAVLGVASWVCECTRRLVCGVLASWVWRLGVLCDTRPSARGVLGAPWKVGGGDWRRT